MKITGSINESEFKKTLRQYSKAVGVGLEDAVEKAAESSAKALASKMRPYGLSAKKGQDFQDNIAEQIRHVRYGVNVGAYRGSSIEAAHENQRKQGRVRIRKVRGSGWDNTISEGEMHSYTRKKQAQAGIAKAGWFAAFVQAARRRLSRKPAKWISRHIQNKYGNGRKTNKGLSVEYQMENTVPYIHEAQKPQEVASALRQGRKNFLRHMQQQIDKAASKVR